MIGRVDVGGGNAGHGRGGIGEPSEVEQRAGPADARETQNARAVGGVCDRGVEVGQAPLEYPCGRERGPVLHRLSALDVGERYPGAVQLPQQHLGVSHEGKEVADARPRIGCHVLNRLERRERAHACQVESGEWNAGAGPLVLGDSNVKGVQRRAHGGVSQLVGEQADGGHEADSGRSARQSIVDGAKKRQRAGVQCNGPRRIAQGRGLNEIGGVDVRESRAAETGGGSEQAGGGEPGSEWVSHMSGHQESSCVCRNGERVRPKFRHLWCTRRRIVSIPATAGG